MRGGRQKKKSQSFSAFSIWAVLRPGGQVPRLALSLRRSHHAETAPGVLTTSATHICKHISFPVFHLTASFSLCSYGSPIPLLGGDLEVWQVAGGIQPEWGKWKPNRGMKCLESPGFTWAPDERGLNVWLCNKEKEVLSPDTGPC